MTRPRKKGTKKTQQDYRAAENLKRYKAREKRKLEESIERNKQQYNKRWDRVKSNNANRITNIRERRRAEANTM